jgi:hypothetical protein
VHTWIRLLSEGKIEDESKRLTMRRKVDAILSTRKETRGNGIGRSGQSPIIIVSRAIMKREIMTIAGYRKHHIQAPRIYTYFGSAQE